MSSVKLDDGWPPLESPIRLTPPRGEPVQATFKTFRPSGEFRIYQLQTSDGVLLTAIADREPLRGEVMLVVSGLGDPFSVLVEAAHA